MSEIGCAGVKLQERPRSRNRQHRQPVKTKRQTTAPRQAQDRRLKDSESSALRRRGEEEKKKRIKEEQEEPSSDSTGTAVREQDETVKKYNHPLAEVKRQKEQMTNPEVAEISAAEQTHHGDTVLSQKKEPSGVSSTMPEQKKKISRKPI